jgi:hypothetical protein
MPDLRLLSVTRWEKYVPDLPGNRNAPQPFHFELHATMTKEQSRALRQSLEPLETSDKPQTPEEQRIAKVERYAKALEPYVKLGPNPLSMDEKPISNIHDYLDAMSRLEFEGYFHEMGWALQRINSVEGLTAFFSERLSGGFTTTAAQNKEAATQRAGR